MKVLCDVHLPYRLVNRLRQRGVDAIHVNRILDGSETKDAAVAAFADANDMVLITKDSDFRDSHFTGLCGMEKKLDLHRFEREDDATILNAVENSGVQQRSDVTVYGLHIPLHAACRFAD
jgi:hypothetical protein